MLLENVIFIACICAIFVSILAIWSEIRTQRKPEEALVSTLDINGLKKLMGLHFKSVFDRLMIVLASEIAKMGSPLNLDRESLFREVKRAIDDSRSYLVHFKSSDVDNILDYLRESLPDEKIKKCVDDIVDILVSKTTIKTKEIKIFYLIKGVQAELIRKINNEFRLSIKPIISTNDLWKGTQDALSLQGLANEV